MPEAISRGERIAAQTSHWDQRYDNPNHLFGYRPNDFLTQSEIMLRRGSRVLVVGDGEGRNGVWLAQRGHRVTSVDLSEVASRKATAWAAEKGVDLDVQVGDIVTWLAGEAGSGPWDAVVWIFCHLHPDVRRDAARLTIERMAPGARLILEAYTPAQIGLGTGGPPHEELTLTRERVYQDWAGLELDVHLTERRIFEGPGHQGLSSVIQVLGLKRP